nr:hypothetical protein [Mycoplasmopsis bovis]
MTPHINAPKGSIAKLVLMPWRPFKSKVYCWNIFRWRIWTSKYS